MTLARPSFLLIPVACLLPFTASLPSFHGRGSPGAPAVVRVAVLDFAVVDNSANGDSESLARWFRDQRIEPTQLLRSALVEPETYAALDDAPAVLSVPARHIRDALRERGFDPAACAVTCALRIGTEVGADRVITGEVTKLSNLIWFVTARVADVRSGKVLRQDEFEVKGIIQDMMPRVMASLSRRLVTA